ncbi:hypothetical protein LAZ67_X001669 [Cordylochernes scorpioides]|uniref:Helix-turn-helix domain-containing protein n=1 Tax=Cordylochernes scorpioides TaxID=51811 RepID=A0ABY6LSM3_9ARAC|nr:hypothetical protein LAZ67_X001669 [Cordylochernes scorpioides]
MKEQYDRNSKSYPKVNVGEDAWCQMHPRETWTPVKISAQADSPQSFEVVTPSGNRLIRNQQFIRPRDGVNEKSQLSSEPITGSPEAQHPHYDSPTMGESSTAPIQRSSEETNIDQREGATTSAGISPEPSGRPRFSRNQNKIETKIYRKPTHTGSYLNFNSFGPICHKVAVVKTLSKRLTTHFTDKTDEKIEKARLFQELQNNNYPKEFIKKQLYTPKIPSTNNTQISTPNMFCSLPYSYGCERIARSLKKHNITTRYQPNQNLRSIFRHPDTKQIYKPEDRADVVYKIPCKSCQAIYIGETSKPLSERINQHKSALKRHNPTSLLDNQVDPRTAESIVALSSLCLDFTTFTFNNQLFKQIRGSPMGSPLSSPLAEIVMANIDHWVQQQIAPGIHMWRRYIDDIFCICDTGQEINILDSLNSYHPEISFTLELENRSVLPYLDILVIRTASHYHTTVYHKVNNPTFYTDFKSSCPLSHKINTVRTLTKRLFTHCSLPLFRTIEFSLIIKPVSGNRCASDKQNQNENKEDKKIVKSTGNKRKYVEDYLKYGFIPSVNDPSRPFCLICQKTLSNETMVPSKLLRHIETNHREQMNNPISYFENIRSSFQKQSKKFKKFMTTSDEAQTASYMIAQLIARKKKAHAEAEEIILPALKIVAGCNVNE